MKQYAKKFVVFRHLASVPTPHGPSRESVRPVLGHSGEPVGYPDLRAAYAAADRMERQNRSPGQDCCANLHYTAGWLGEWE